MLNLKNRIMIETEYPGANVSCVVTEKGLVYMDSPFLLLWSRTLRPSMLEV
ncbi:MAG: hypothetical protein AB1585_17030 [Thermodesulfobacteriota bacterium]